MSRYETFAVDRRQAYFARSAKERARCPWVFDWRYENGKQVLAIMAARPSRFAKPAVVVAVVEPKPEAKILPMRRRNG